MYMCDCLSDTVKINVCVRIQIGIIENFGTHFVDIISSLKNEMIKKEYQNYEYWQIPLIIMA